MITALFGGIIGYFVTVAIAWVTAQRRYEKRLRCAESRGIDWAASYLRRGAGALLHAGKAFEATALERAADMLRDKAAERRG